MGTVLVILLIISISVSVFALWALKKLNQYIARLEAQIELHLDRIDELEDFLITSKTINKKIIRKNIITDDNE